jgi:SAM-dependent methyltransferase
LYPDARTVSKVHCERWRYRGLEVCYRPELDGCGRGMAPAFVEFIKRHYPRQRFARLFEWCAGPGFIGFALLRERICNHLCLADINPEAIDCIAETVRRNGLRSQVSFYLSDNCRGIPRHEVFDMVVANPPNYCHLNPRHPLYDAYKDDLRPNDPGWRIHRAFYAQIRRHLAPGGVLLISEIEPRRARVHVAPGEPAWDLRPRPPLADFQAMIAAGGLTFVRAAPFAVGDGARVDLLVSRRATKKGDSPLFCRKKGTADSLGLFRTL